MIRYQRINLQIGPTELYQKLRNKFDNTILLETAENSDKFSTQSIICFSPEYIMKIKEHRLYQDEMVIAEGLDDILLTLENILKKYNPTNEIATENQFKGGLIGYISYDFVKYIEDLPESSPSEFPDAYWGLYLDGIIFNHTDKTIEYFHHHNKEPRIELLIDVLNDQSVKKTNTTYSNIEHTVTKEQFEQSVRSVKQGIVEGETFQTVISQRINFRVQGDRFDIYQKLRKINPSPYMYCLEFKDLAIIGSSPELLISVTNDEVTTYPIAGTRPLGETPEETEKYRKQLLNDEKEKAEHNMLVDLARNDVGKIAEFGTVNIPEYLKIEEFSHVMHIVSKVTGELRNELTMFDALKAIFPAGTVTGAPKIRSMEIIENHEPQLRGPYAGCVGYFGIFNECIQAITIRTAFGIEDQFSIQAGAGIVLDSDPTKEYEETLHKLAALLEILQGDQSTVLDS